MSSPAYAFGPFTLDPADRRLLREGEPVEVTARYFDALLLLVGENGRLVSKGRFHDEVWNGIPVTDEALTQCIRTLRRALGDDAASPRYIETVPRHGYRFVASVETPAVAAPIATRGNVANLLPEIAAAAMGGATAGIVGALGYLSLGMVSPGIGTASTLLVLVSVNLLLGLIGGAAVGAGIAMLAPRGGWAVAGGALGGMLVGALGHMVGGDLFQLFFGRAPANFTGALEGLALGTAAGTGTWLAARAAGASIVRRIAPGFVAGAIAGVFLAIAGGRLMVGSLVQLAARFPDSRLAIGDLSLGWLAAATVAEAALFAGSVAAAIELRRRLHA